MSDTNAVDRKPSRQLEEFLRVKCSSKSGIVLYCISDYSEIRFPFAPEVIDI